jgi:flagellin FlaB
MKRDNAFIGLEVAIVLIAFVVVAVALSYVTLNAGLSTIQQVQEVTEIRQSVSNAIIDGPMYAKVTDDKLDGMMFNVQISLGGEAVDMSTTTFTFASSKHPTPRVLQNIRNEAMSNKGTEFMYATAGTTLTDAVEMKDGVSVPVNTGADYTIMGYYPTETTSVLTSGEFATFMLNIGADSLDAKDWFTLEVRPSNGAAILIIKTLGDSGVKGGEAL